MSKIDCRKVVVIGDREWGNIDENLSDNSPDSKRGTPSPKQLAIQGRFNPIRNALSRLGDDVHLIVGTESGATSMARGVWDSMSRPYTQFPINWEKNEDNLAPIRRNEAMFDKNESEFTNNQQPVGVLAFHDNIHNSRATMPIVTNALRRGIPVTIFDSNGGFKKFQTTEQLRSEAESSLF